MSATDVDLDGALDALTPGGARLALGLDEETAWTAPEGTVALAADLDDDLSAEIVTLDGGEVVEHDVTAAGAGVRLALIGRKDNRRGVGAIVEVLAGPLYRRLWWRGEPVTVGLGGEPEAQVVRVRWPNGVVQNLTRVAAGTSHVIVQDEGLVGSCPFLYTWNGSEYEFVSDVLGITPLGLPMVPGVLVPPDHDEYVLITGDQMAVKDGAYEVQITRSCARSRTWTAVRLDVVDHPADVAVWPDERFTFPPFPPPHVHTTRGLAGRCGRSTATGATGPRSWRRSTAAAPFPSTPTMASSWASRRRTRSSCTSTPNRSPRPSAPRLVMTGWFYWTDRRRASTSRRPARPGSTSFRRSCRSRTARAAGATRDRRSGSRRARPRPW